MATEPYYHAYEARYKAVFAAGIERWGHAPSDQVLVATLRKWVEDNKLQGKRVIEFACGEGAGGEILSELGCIYHGVDVSPTVVEKTRKALERFPDATVELLDMVNGQLTGKYDAALDIMGFHMLVLDSDRSSYLRNAFNCLENGAPMLFDRETYRRDAPASDEKIESIEQWTALTGDDYKTPQLRKASQNGIDVEVNIPLVPARAKNKSGYINELSAAGFVIDDFVEMDASEQVVQSASIFVHKPNV
jgi:hypothetical protein